MNGLASLLIVYLVNSLWQIPLIVIAAWTAARMLRPVGPAAEHRVWVAALMLEASLPALSMAPWERMHFLWPWSTHAGALVDGDVAVVTSAGTAFAALRVPPAIVAMLVAAYLAITAFCAVRFAWQWIRLGRLNRSADLVDPGAGAAIDWKPWTRRLEQSQIVLASSAEIFAPVTMGIMVKRVLLPKRLIRSMSQSELDAAISHELAHIRRNDFAKNLFYEIVALVGDYHPGVWFTRQRMTETREMVCDEMAAGDTGNQEYAQSLLRLAHLLLQGRPVRVPQAIGIFDSNILERRLMKLTETKKRVGRGRRVILAGACVVLGLATAGSAVALRLSVDQKDNEALSKGIPSTVPPEQMQERLTNKVTPVYPPAAKKARTQGKVELDAVIGLDGHVENLKVVSGPNELQQSAMDAVRQWVYKPFLVHGNPVEVKTTISVIYTLKK